MKDFIRKKGIYIAIAAVIIAIISAVSVALNSSNSDLAAQISGTVLKPVKGVMSSLVNSLERLYDYAYKYDTIVEENEELKNRVSNLEEEYRESTEIHEENERLRNLLGLSKRHSDYRYETATIISWTASNLSSSFTINKGSASGLELYDCIITDCGDLVGQITELGTSSATVTTILDTTSSIGVFVYETGETAVLEGDFELLKSGYSKLSYLQDDTDVATGSAIVTSGKGGTFPQGLMIGTVEDVVIGPSGLDTYAAVKPSANINGLTHVFVITDFEVTE